MGWPEQGMLQRPSPGSDAGVSSHCALGMGFGDWEVRFGDLQMRFGALQMRFRDLETRLGGPVS